MYNYYINCYETCSTCDEVGDSNDHKCKTCKNELFMDYGTQNCISECGCYLYQNSTSRKCENCRDKPSTDETSVDPNKRLWKYPCVNECIEKKQNHLQIFEHKQTEDQETPNLVKDFNIIKIKLKPQHFR